MRAIGADADPVSTSNSDERPVLDPDFLAQIMEVERDLGESLLAGLASRFLNESPRRMSELLDAVSRHSVREVAEHAHWFVNVGSTLGALRLCAAASELDRPNDPVLSPLTTLLVDTLQEELVAALEACTPLRLAS